MALFDIGRLCVKIAGRDAGRKCVVLSTEKDGMVLVDGETRRRKCNVRHLEPLGETLKLKADASRADVTAAFKKLGIELRDTKAKKAAARPKRVRKKKAAKEPEEKNAAKKPAPKEPVKGPEAGVKSPEPVKEPEKGAPVPEPAKKESPKPAAKPDPARAGKKESEPAKPAAKPKTAKPAEKA